MIGVNKYFGNYHALKNIQFCVDSAERIVLCGPSGSGKSTLVRCINQLEHVQSGRIVVDGIDVTAGRKNSEAVRKEVGMVFQRFNLFPHMTAIENCMLAPLKVRGVPKREAHAMAQRLLDRVHIGAHANKYPAQLSGGQQQRVAIARALCMNPKIMTSTISGRTSIILRGRPCHCCAKRGSEPRACPHVGFVRVEGTMSREVVGTRSPAMLKNAAWSRSGSLRAEESGS
jgi:ABC-type histidine transport system ATPase subunit